ncbi:MAG: hypothetical protein RMK92_06305 [Armatimonadota bacterium]|nr:hypothetical protein [Armatimonadota bacterium]
MRSQGILLSFCVAMCLVLMVSHHLSAQVLPRVEVRGSTLLVNREVALRVRVANGDLAPEQRVRIAAERLQAAVARGLGAQHIGVRKERRRAAVTLGGGVLLYATRADAREAGTTPSRLAQAWASSLRHCLSIPPLSLSTRELLVPLGEARLVRVNTWLEGTVVVAPTGAPDDGVADPAIIGDGRTVRVVGRTVGREQILVSVGEVSVPLMVTVRKYAGEVRVSEPVVVTGIEPSADFVRQAVEAAILRSAQLEPGAQLQVMAPVRLSSVPDVGQSTTATAQVRASGSGYIAREQQVQLSVVNRPFSFSEPVLLMVSNDPERVQRAQTLFAGEVSEARGARLLYHHMNGMVQDGLFLIELLNPTEVPRMAHLTGAASVPMRDTVRVGYVAGELFLRALTNNIGHVVLIPPKSKVVLLAQRIRPLDTASGVLQVRLLSQGDGQPPAPCLLKVAMLAYQNQPLPLLGTTTAWGFTPPRPLTPQEYQQIADTEHIYPTSQKVLTATYIVGQRWQFIRIGEQAVQNHREQRRLSGNYGVIYEVRVEIVNPTDQVRDVEIVFEPSGGEAGGVFVIGSEVRGVPRAFPPREFSIARLRLQPGQRRSVTIRTMPLAGSNYPATLMVRS